MTHILTPRKVHVRWRWREDTRKERKNRATALTAHSLGNYLSSEFDLLAGNRWHAEINSPRASVDHLTWLSARTLPLPPLIVNICSVSDLGEAGGTSSKPNFSRFHDLFRILAFTGNRGSVPAVVRTFLTTGDHAIYFVIHTTSVIFLILISFHIALVHFFPTQFYSIVFH